MHKLLTHKEFETYLLGLPDTFLDYPFGQGTAVYKVIPKGSRGLHGEQIQGDAEQASKAYKDTANEPAKDGNAVDDAMRASAKMFALITEGKEPVQISLKCDPKLAEVLREKYETVVPGYHLNKKHWNTIIASGQLSGEEIKDLINHSYLLVSGRDAI